MHYGSQDDIEFLKSLKVSDRFFDIIVDDGGHTMAQQTTSLVHLLRKVKSGGLYIIEDLHTSYFADKSKGYILNLTTIE
jgi:hypothetical protein